MVAEDRELVALLKAGNADALEQLITRWRPGAEAYARGILRDPQAAEDAVQEAFSRVWAVRSGLNADYSFGDKPEEFSVKVLGRVLGVVGKDDIADSQTSDELEEVMADDVKAFKVRYGVD